MPKRVVVIVPFALDETGMANRRSQLDSVSLGPDIEFDFRPVKAGPALLDSYHDAIAGRPRDVRGGRHRAGGRLRRRLHRHHERLRRQRPALRARHPGDRPGPRVVPDGADAGRSKFSVLTQWDALEGALRARACASSASTDKCASIRSINMPPDVTNLLGGKEEVVFPKLVGRGHALHRGGRRRGHLPGLHDDAPGARRTSSRTCRCRSINPGPLTYALARDAARPRASRRAASATRAPNVPKREMAAAMLDAAATTESATV